MKIHQKHTKLTMPLGGRFHRNEIAFMGAPCGVIQELASKLSDVLSDYRVGYVDADHGSEGAEKKFAKQYTDKIGHHQLNFDDPNIEYSFRALFNDVDITLVNGNHFKAEKQIVLINSKKKESLEKKLDRLTNVLLFVSDEGEAKIHDFLKNEFSNVPVVRISDLDKISKSIKEQIQVPKIKGLVLAGGKSQRMGQDKGNLDYHGKPQKEHTADLLAKFCDEVYFSKQVDDGSESLPVITDKFVGLGPYGGILSAFQSDPNAAWLVVATDMPLLDRNTLQQLVDNRDPSKLATCFHNPETKFPEPLITIWEPRAYPRLLSFLSQGFSCPRKALINSDIHELHLDDPTLLRNANTPEEREDLMDKING